MVYNTEKDSSTIKDPTSLTLAHRSHVTVLRNVSESPLQVFLSQIFLPPLMAAIREIFWSRKFCDIRYSSLECQDWSLETLCLEEFHGCTLHHAIHGGRGIASGSNAHLCLLLNVPESDVSELSIEDIQHYPCQCQLGRSKSKFTKFTNSSVSVMLQS